MIYIEREAVDEHGTPIRPSGEWFRDSDAATERAIRERDVHEVDDNLYRHVQVKTALEKLFHDKCAYCEWNMTGGSDWDVEHFRPKGRVAERKDHPGYYWLAYTWSNLYPSCTHCNQKRKDKPRWADSTALPAAGKLDQFPLQDETTRVMSPDDNDQLPDEQKLLIDPCYDNPEEYFGFDPKGGIFSLDANPYGEVTIKVFNLNRRRLSDLRRKESLVPAIKILKLVQKFEREGNEDAAQDFRSLLDCPQSDSAGFAAVTRYVVRNPEAFNIS